MTVTPLPAASPSYLTTYGRSELVEVGERGRPGCCGRGPRAVGTPAATMTSLANALLPSSRAAAAVGPKAASPRSASASTAPATSGTSGPTTSGRRRASAASSATASGSRHVERPGLGDLGRCRRCRARRRSRRPPGSRAQGAGSSACSRPPEPTTRTSHRPAPPPHEHLAQDERLVPAGTDADRGDRRAGELLDALDVGPGRGGQVVERPGLALMSSSQPGSVS